MSAYPEVLVNKVFLCCKENENFCLKVNILFPFFLLAVNVTIFMYFNFLNKSFLQFSN